MTKCLVTVGALLGASIASQAQDSVTVRGPDGELKQRSGLVRDVNADRLVLEVNGREQQIPYEQVVAYRTAIDGLVRPGDQLYAERKFELAYEAYGKGIEASTPAWMRRRLQAGRVRSATQMQAWVTATNDFLALVSSDPQTEYFGVIPLVWSPSRPDPATARKTAGWLASNNRLEKLIGASHGLTDLTREESRKVLSVLAADADPRIAALAAAQRWRAEPAPPVSAIQQWQDHVDAMPDDLRCGPAFVVGSAWMQFDREQSVLQLLKIPVLYHDQFELAARSLDLAADQLIQLGRLDEARIVLRELVDRHHGTPEADLASAKLSKLAPASQPNQP